ncbi:Outer membrane lipoprotein carrier protein LolA [hydrothermal vent metagenome]|uniref:Outer-membrane lipoprotein carrier protein n=1 Tax=hydrothermal vent metagenome TaxID=652676 RepID=A0A3B0ZIA0_9ZZZZ
MRPLFTTPLRILVLLWIFVPFTVHADQVGDYFAALKTFEANFTQHVVGANGETLQDAAGEVWISTPGRFRWNYLTPYKQLIVSDGKQLWNYDADLEQASVSPVDDRLTSTPAMLLSGVRPLSEVMNTKPIGKENGVDWYQLEPKSSDAAVEAVKIGFRKGQLEAIEVRDGFGNQTRIQFSDIKLNQTVDPALFELDLPPGTDVIGNLP